MGAVTATHRHAHGIRWHWHLAGGTYTRGRRRRQTEGESRTTTRSASESHFVRNKKSMTTTSSSLLRKHVVLVNDYCQVRDFEFDLPFCDADRRLIRVPSPTQAQSSRGPVLLRAASCSGPQIWPPPLPSTAATPCCSQVAPPNLLQTRTRHQLAHLLSVSRATPMVRPTQRT